MSNAEQLHEADRRFLEQIKRVGWNVTRAPKSARGRPVLTSSFSCGLYLHFQHPGIVVFGLDADTRITVVHNIGRHVQEGKVLQDGGEYDEMFEEIPCPFRSVNEGRYADVLGWAIWFYEHDPFPVLQCFWPDKNGLYPWDPRSSS